MIDFKNYDKAVIVSGDGDLTCLVRYLLEQQKLERVIIPNQNKYSALLRKVIRGQYGAFLNGLEKKLGYIKKKMTP